MVVALVVGDEVVFVTVLALPDVAVELVAGTVLGAEDKVEDTPDTVPVVAFARLPESPPVLDVVPDDGAAVVDDGGLAGEGVGVVCAGDEADDGLVEAAGVEGAVAVSVADGVGDGAGLVCAEADVGEEVAGAVSEDVAAELLEEGASALPADGAAAVSLAGAPVEAEAVEVGCV